MDKERCALSRQTVPSASAPQVRTEIRSPAVPAPSINVRSSDPAKRLKSVFKDAASTSVMAWFVALAQYATFQRVSAFARKTLLAMPI